MPRHRIELLWVPFPVVLRLGHVVILLRCAPCLVNATPYILNSRYGPDDGPKKSDQERICSARIDRRTIRKAPHIRCRTTLLQSSAQFWPTTIGSMPACWRVRERARRWWRWSIASEEVSQPRPTIAFSGTETLSIVEYPAGVFVPRENAFPALFLKFSNDAVKGVSTRVAKLKATIIYREGGIETRRITASWLERGSGELFFDVDSSHKLILCFIFKDELCTFSQASQIAHRRTFWTGELHSFGKHETLTAVVRLTGTSSGIATLKGNLKF